MLMRIFERALEGRTGDARDGLQQTWWEVA